MGNERIKLLSDKFINYKKKNISLLDNIIRNFSFCSKIYIICNKERYQNNLISFKKNKKINLIFLKNSNNQIKSILKLKNKIKKNEKVLILNYDSTFDFNHRKINKNVDGSIYSIKQNELKRNFNPKDVFIEKNNYIKKIFKKKKLLNIKEKTSAGLYYLKKWGDFLDAAMKIKDLNKRSLHVIDIFIKLIQKKNITSEYVDNFMCFDNDNKIEEYKFWKKYFLKNKSSKDQLKKLDIQNIIPSAGEGSRHKKLGYSVPKPLIPIARKKMFERSIESLPNPSNNLFIFRDKTFKKFKLNKKFKSSNSKSKFYLIKNKTKGMAITINKAKHLVQLNKPVLVSSCDIKCVINYKKLYSMIKKYSPEGIIFSWSGYPFASESPNSHAYVGSKNSIVNLISEKKTISNNPDLDSAVTGIFYFKSGKHLLDCINYSIKNKVTVNGEYYIATAMTKLLNDKKKIMNFKVDQLISWSLPEHLRDYLFWEKKFK